jgi:tetratricopeptide (TPR) repeat protein
VTRPTRFWEGAFVVGGVLAVGITLRSYRSFDALSGRPEQNRLSPGQARSAVSSAKAYLSSNPEDMNVWSQLAVAYYSLGQESYPAALNALEKARSLGATSDSLFYYAGVMYEALGLPDYAVNELSKYLRHTPDDYDAEMRLANLLVQLKKYDDALKLYQVLAKSGPSDPTLWYNYAVVSKEKGDLDGALSSFKKLHALMKVLPEGGLFQEGEVMRLKGSDDQAMALYQQEISLHPSYLPALTALEAAQKRKGLSKDARETRKKITQLKQK